MVQTNRLGSITWWRLGAYFGGDSPRALGLLSIFVVIFAGRYSLDRFLQEASRTPWLELRVWASALAGILVVFLWQKMRQPLPKFSKELLLFLGALLLLQAYFVGNLLLLGNEIYRAGHLFDIALFFCGTALVILYFRNEQDWVVFCKLTEVLGGMLFLLAAAGFGNPDLNGPGWAPFGGPITFNRLEFFAFCAASYLSAKSGSLHGKILHTLIGAIALYSTFASLSKSAVAAAVIVLLYCLYWLLSAKSYRQTAALFVSSVAVIFCFSQLQGPNLQARIQAVVDVGKTANVGKSIDVARSRYSFIDAGIRNIYSNELRIEDLNEEQQRRVIALWEVYRGQLPDYRTDLAGFVRSIDRFVVIVDTSDRLRMWLEAYELLKNNKWFGVGIGNFIFAELNYYAPGGIDNYHYPHNIILDLLASMGIVGFLLFGLALFVLLVLVRQQMHLVPDLLFVKGYLLFILITAMFAGDYFDFRIFWLIALAAVLSHSERLAGETAGKER